MLLLLRWFFNQKLYHKHDNNTQLIYTRLELIVAGDDDRLNKL